jgi:general secretion pathway protein L
MMRQSLLLMTKAWQWWLAEFLSLLPWSHLQRFTRSRFKLFIRPCEASTEIVLNAGDKILMRQEIPKGSASEEELVQIKSAIQAAAIGKRMAVIGVIPARESLDKPLTLPLAAKAHLDEAVRYQIERISPFKGDNTLYSVKLLGSDENADALRLNLTIVPRVFVEGLEALGARLGLGIEQFVLERVGSRLEPLAFQTEAEAPAKLSLATKAFLAASLILLTTLLLVPVLEKKNRAAALEREIGLVKPKADQVLKLSSERDKIMALRSQVIGLKRVGQPPIAILSKLSEILDDQSFLFEFRIEGAVVTISGLSSDASKLAQRLGEASAFKSVKFSGPVLRDQQAERDRFTLIVELAAAS